MRDIAVFIVRDHRSENKDRLEEELDEEWGVVNDGVVEKEKARKIEGERSEKIGEETGRRYTLGELIDRNSLLRRTKSLTPLLCETTQSYLEGKAR